MPVQGLAASNDYEDKKLKMRKAMGESLHDAPVNESESAEERRLNTIRCADWQEQPGRKSSVQAHPYSRNQAVRVFTQSWLV